MNNYQKDSCSRLSVGRQRPKTLVGAVVVACLLSACSLAPKTAMEPMPVPLHWKNAAPAEGWVIVKGPFADALCKKPGNPG